MKDIDVARTGTLGKMAQSRAEIRRLLESASQPAGSDQSAGAGVGEEFPRSRTMRTLLSGPGVGTVAAVVGGLLIARPALALRLLRMIPAGRIARTLLVKAISALRGARQPRR